MYPADAIASASKLSVLEVPSQSTLRALFDFLERDVTESVQRYFDDRVRADRAHFGRWADEVPADLRAKVNRRYEQIWRELRDEGYELTPID